MKLHLRRGNSIEDVRIRTLRLFTGIAFASSIFVFLAFSIRLVVQEEDQFKQHLMSFKDVAEQFYHQNPTEHLKLSDSITAYYSLNSAPKAVKDAAPIEAETIDRLRYPIQLSDSETIEGGVVVYHFEFEHEGKTIPAYLVIESTGMDRLIDSWDVLMVISTLLMLFLVVILRLVLKRVFEQLMQPISDLTQQLSLHNTEFSVSAKSVDELQLLTEHLNSFSKMKDRLARQELMFAKYASHELKTPIAVVLGAANLQAMKPKDSEFQAKQRERILLATHRMKDTVEALLSIVKQENATDSQETVITVDNLDLSKCQQQLPNSVTLTVNVAPETTLNMPQILIDMVLKNYIDNAIRFTQQGEIQVDICSDSLSVTDPGTGITDNAQTEHGLGLVIVERIGKSYGWRSTLVNRPEDQGPGCIACFSKLEPSHSQH